MKRNIISFFLALLCTSHLFAQQGQIDKRSHSVFVLPDFSNAKIYLNNMRFVRAKANIFLKNSTLCFLRDDEVIEASLDNVTLIDFDSIQYIPIRRQVARIVSTVGVNKLLRITTIDKKKLEEERNGGTNLPFFEIEELNVFLEVDGDKDLNAKLYPITDRYLYYINGKIIPAVQSKIKKYIRPNYEEQFRLLMLNKYWSWSDEKSLEQLLQYFKK